MHIYDSHGALVKKITGFPAVDEAEQGGYAGCGIGSWLLQKIKPSIGHLQKKLKLQPDGSCLKDG